MKVTVVRIYLSESDNAHEKLLRRLHDDEKVRGVTLFRGVSGFGKTGKVHSSSLLYLSLDLPIVVEFFDTPERVEEILGHICGEISPEHVMTFDAEVR
ncbi:MAG: DUF190 domain-containing protein [Pseudomonadota bacterium]|nr:DUF190 domain-containing protein [Pseudomonadota bacterium]